MIRKDLGTQLLRCDLETYYENHADAETSYARFAENGSEVQAMFDASATCEGPNASDSYQFYPDPDDEA